MDLQNIFEKKLFLRQWRKIEDERGLAFDRLQMARAALREARITTQEKRAQLEEAVTQARAEYWPEEHTRLHELARSQGFHVTWDCDSDTYDLAPMRAARSKRYG